MTQHRPPEWLRVGSTREPAAQPAASDPHAPSVLFVCTGNICRSAFAACWSRSHLQGRGVTVGSAGIGALVGHPMDSVMAGIAAEQDVPTSDHRAQQLTGRLLKGTDVVVTFGPEHNDWIFENHPEAFSRVLAIGQIAHAVHDLPGEAPLPLAELLLAVRSARPEPHDEDWIADPYRRSVDEYRRAATQIVASLRELEGRVSWSPSHR